VKFELTILGSNSALPTSKRFPTAQVLNVLERFSFMPLAIRVLRLGALLFASCLQVFILLKATKND